jgi:putative CocE/NonD family hydrolase
MFGRVRWPFWLALAVVLAILPFAPRLRSRLAGPPRVVAAPDANYIARVAMIQMRDGVRLCTLIVIPKGGQRLPIVLTRTPNGVFRYLLVSSPRLRTALPPYEADFADGGYIRVYQDVRGRFDSEGEYVVTRPLRGPLNATATDHATDAWDTIDWLVKNVPESNGRVGMLGLSYEGFTTAMALVDPHPALKVAAPENPMIDGWMGDDWFHYGAFRQVNFDYFAEELAMAGGTVGSIPDGSDDYENFLRAGAAGDIGRVAGLDALPFWQDLTAHPAYDAYWQAQAVDRVLSARPLTVPTLWVQGLWDQEDIWGAVHGYAAIEPKDIRNDMNYLVIGPWRHGQLDTIGSGLGPLRWNGDTALQFRHTVLKPFFDQYLVEGAAQADIPPVLAYDTGKNAWQRYVSWPLACASGCAATSRPMYLQSGFGLGFERPTAVAADEYVSDPANPVPFHPRPVLLADPRSWSTWLVADQRFAQARADVLTYVTAPLTEPLHIGGAPFVNLVAATSGTDSDWVVKLIDVFPGAPLEPGYELPISMDIFRGRYRASFAQPQALAPDAPLTYRFALPTASHVFAAGHRVMVQIQSSWFPLYDRNPQTFVPNIFDAAPADYRQAVQHVYRGGANASFIELPIAP